MILSLYGKIRVREYTYSGVFYTVYSFITIKALVEALHGKFVIKFKNDFQILNLSHSSCIYATYTKPHFYFNFLHPHPPTPHLIPLGATALDIY